MAPTRDPQDLFAAPSLPVAKLDDAQKLACLRLIRSENVGPATFRALINHFGGAREALDALPALGRRGGKRSIRVCSEASAAAELEAAARSGVSVVFTIEPGYPQALAWVEGGPPVLYLKGRPELLNRPMIAIVGARQASALGQKFAATLATELAAAGFVVASGLARGIDAAAHQAALRTGTVAVVAGGIDIVYPPEHAALQKSIGEDGCLISEQPMGFEPRAQDFPRRNRIISGISLGVAVVEAARRSGSLITARMAADQGREVFAVPGHPLDPRAEGTNALLKDGATLVTGAEDIITALRSADGRTNVRKFAEVPEPEPVRADMPEPGGARFGAPAPIVEPGDAQRARVLSALGLAPTSVEDLVQASQLPVRTVQVIIMELAIAGRLEFHGRQLVSLR